MLRGTFGCNASRVGRSAAGALVLGLVLAWADPLSAQESGRVTGLVTNATSGEPIVGAQISVVGTGVGALTNNVGQFLLIDVPLGQQQIQAQFIGFGTVTGEVTVTAGDAAELNLELRSEAISLEGVVVTGTAGQARRREVGNSMAQINAAQVENAPIADVTDMLQGRAAGAMIMENTGQVGAATTIRLRGNNSVSQGNTPLIYVDGVRINNDASASFDEAYQSTTGFSDLNPNDIERVEIIKGAAATTLYGTEAAAGVIQVFTKQGADGSPAWSLSIDQGMNFMGHVGPDENINPTGLGLNRCNSDLDSHFPADHTCPASGSWFKNGHSQMYDLSVRGGADALNYFVSGRFGDERGVVADQGQDQWGVRGNFGFAPRPDLTIRLNSAYAHKNITWIPDGDNAEGFLLNVLRGENDYAQSAGVGDGNVFDLDLTSLTDHFTTGLNLMWTPTQSFSHRFNVGLDWNQTDYREERPFGFFYEPSGNREVDAEWTRKLTLDYSGTWSTELGASLTSSLSWGGQLYDDFLSRLNGTGESFAGPGDKDLDSGSLTNVEETRVSETNGGFFLQEMVGWQDKAFLTAGLRVDGHSAFGDDFGWAPYPKVSLAYMISEESFWPRVVPALKLRTAYGESGKAPGIFDAVKTWDAVSGDEGLPAVTPATLGDPDLGPERSREYEVGFEGAAIDGRITFDYSWYYQTTVDALIEVQERPSSGFAPDADLGGGQLRNVGEIENRGHEAMVNFNVLRRPGLNWDVGVQYSTNDSKVVELGEGLESINIGWRNYARPDEPLPSFCDQVLADSISTDLVPEGRPSAEYLFEDKCIGVTYPTHTYGINTSITIGKRLTLDALGEGQGGHVLSSGPAYQNVRRSVWPECYEIQGQISEAQEQGTVDDLRLTAYEWARCDPNLTTYGMWTEAADFFKIRSLSASYRIPEYLLPGGVRGATVRLQARNLFTFTDYPGLDPEAYQDGSSDELYRQEYYNLPPVRSLLMSVKVDF